VAAEAAGATANGDRNRERRVPADAPLAEPARQALLVGPVRLALGAAGLAAAIAIDLAAEKALVAAALGAVLTIFTLVAPRGRERPSWRSVPAEPMRHSSWRRSLAVAMFPSTYTVALLAGIALGFNRTLTAVLAGVLIGMGGVALVYGLLAWAER
jgi:hypothetical protein